MQTPTILIIFSQTKMLLNQSASFTEKKGVAADVFSCGKKEKLLQTFKLCCLVKRSADMLWCCGVVLDNISTLEEEQRMC